MVKVIFQRSKFMKSFLLCLAAGIWSWIAGVGLQPVGACPLEPQSAPVVKGKVTQKAPAGRRATRRAPAGKDASASEEAQGTVLAGGRDPFKLPPPPRPVGPGGALDMAAGPLPPGTRGLVINQLKLGGIVRQDLTNTMLVVVSNYTNRAYFLRENDVVYNGVVSKITPDAVTFRENYLDANGRVQTREVVKRLSQAPGEGR